jgi:putative hemolysin
MTHRSSIVYLSLSDSVEVLKTKVHEDLHSVYPVCAENLDNVIGVVLLKDLFVGLNKDNFNLKKILKEPVYLIEHTLAYKALEIFKISKVHYAFVMDEFGVFQGIITLNDILEALVGDASDFDDDEYLLVANDDETWTIDGQYSLHDFLTYFDLDELTSDYEVTTVSGFIITELGNIPKPGETLIWQKFELEVITMDGVKIEKVGMKAIKD